MTTDFSAYSQRFINPGPTTGVRNTGLKARLAQLSINGGWANIPRDMINIHSARCTCSTAGKELGRYFRLRVETDGTVTIVREK